MSPSNVEITRRLYDAWNRQDVEGILADLDPEIEWRPYLASVSGKPARGRDGVKAFLADYSENWTTFRVDIEELFESGDDIVTFVHVFARGRESGAEVELSPGHHLVFRDGLLLRLTTHLDRGEALAAAGLRTTEK
jgi:ketosteroid isomerase-like protein